MDDSFCQKSKIIYVLIQKFAQSNFKISNLGQSILIDPGIFNREIYKKGTDIFGHIDAIFITHKHPDHFDLEQVSSIYKTYKPKIYSTGENVKTCQENGVTANNFSIGQLASFGAITVEAVPANHHVRWGEFQGEQVDAFGLVIACGHKKIYHTSDTIPPIKAPKSVSLILLPIGGRNVFSVVEACHFAREVKPDLVIPMHYDAPQDNKVNPNDLYGCLKPVGIETKILKFDDSLNV